MEPTRAHDELHPDRARNASRGRSTLSRFGAGRPPSIHHRLEAILRIVLVNDDDDIRHLHGMWVTISKTRQEVQRSANAPSTYRRGARRSYRDDLTRSVDECHLLFPRRKQRARKCRSRRRQSRPSPRSSHAIDYGRRTMRSELPGASHQHLEDRRRPLRQPERPCGTSRTPRHRCRRHPIAHGCQLPS